MGTLEKRIRQMIGCIMFEIYDPENKIRKKGKKILFRIIIFMNGREKGGCMVQGMISS